MKCSKWLWQVSCIEAGFIGFLALQGGPCELRVLNEKNGVKKRKEKEKRKGMQLNKDIFD